MILTNENIISSLRAQLSESISTLEIAPGTFQIMAPFYHADGDMVEIYVKPSYTDDNTVMITDKGMTWMRLSYTEDMKSESIKRQIESIVKTQRLELNDGEIMCQAPLQSLVSFVGYFAQSIAKVMSISAIDNKAKRSQFLEMFNTFVTEELGVFSPISNYSPIKEEEDYTVDFALKSSNDKSFYIYPVNNSAKAREVMANFLMFQKYSVNFLGMVVFEEFDNIPQKDIRRLLNLTDKSYTDLDNFKKSSSKDILRLSA